MAAVHAFEVVGRVQLIGRQRDGAPLTALRTVEPVLTTLHGVERSAGIIGSCRKGCLAATVHSRHSASEGVKPILSCTLPVHRMRGGWRRTGHPSPPTDRNVTIQHFLGRISMSRRRVCVSAVVMVAAVFSSDGFHLQAQQTRTVNDRVYSDAQFRRGQALYKERCASCHGAALAGESAPPLTRGEFIGAWRGQPLSQLLNQIVNTMTE